MNTNIYRLPNDEFYGYTDSGRRIDMGFWDWCCEEIILQNYVEQGMSYEEAKETFWIDLLDYVLAYRPEDADLLITYDTYNLSLADGHDLMNWIMADYFEYLGFTDIPVEEDDNNG